MGKRKKDGSNLKPGICKGATLREENLGKKKVNVSSILKIKHLQKLAAWAGGEGGIPPLGAFFGYHLAANAEVLGVPLDKSSFFCQRCESNLQPGFNCTVQINKCKKNKRRRSNKKSCNFQNSVIYNCNFCHHRNSIKGTRKGHIKTLIMSLKESRSEPATELNLHCSTTLNETTIEKLQVDDRDSTSKPNCFSIPANDSGDYSAPVMSPAPKLTVLSKNKRKSSELEAGKIQLSSGSNSSKGSSRRKRSWWSLKDIVERKETESNQNVSNYVIPFYMQE